jgi:hypothetical protein
MGRSGKMGLQFFLTQFKKTGVATHLKYNQITVPEKIIEKKKSKH